MRPRWRWTAGASLPPALVGAPVRSPWRGQTSGAEAEAGARPHLRPASASGPGLAAPAGRGGASAGAGVDRGEHGHGRKGKSLAPKGALGPDTGGRSPCGATGRALPGGRTGLARDGGAWSPGGVQSGDSCPGPNGSALVDGASPPACPRELHLDGGLSFTAAWAFSRNTRPRPHREPGSEGNGPEHGAPALTPDPCPAMGFRNLQNQPVVTTAGGTHPPDQRRQRSLPGA